MRGSTSSLQALAVLNPAIRKTLNQSVGPVSIFDCPADQVDRHITQGLSGPPPGWFFAAGSLGTQKLSSLFQLSATHLPKTLRVILGSIDEPGTPEHRTDGKLLELTDGWIPWPVSSQEFLFRLGLTQRSRSTDLSRIFPTDSQNEDLIQQLQGEITELKSLLNRCFLTGLLNRKGIEETLAAECARRDRYDSPISLLMLDIDHFKQINDRYLHIGGDEVLTQLGHHFRSQVRTVDVVGRLGGEEFWVVAPGTDRAGATVLSRRLCESTREKPFFVGGESLHLSVSIGVAVAEKGQPATPTQLYAISARALREAKNQGRDGFIVRSVQSD